MAFGVCCLFFYVCSLALICCGLLVGVRCELPVVVLSVVCCMFFVGCCVLFFLFVVHGLSVVACLLILFCGLSIDV